MATAGDGKDGVAGGNGKVMDETASGKDIKSVKWDRDVTTHGEFPESLEFRDGDTVVNVYDADDVRGVTKVWCCLQLKECRRTWTWRVNHFVRGDMYLGITNETMKRDMMLVVGYPGWISTNTEVSHDTYQIPVPDKAKTHREWKDVVFTADLKNNNISVSIDSIPFGSVFNKVESLEQWKPCVMFREREPPFRQTIQNHRNQSITII